MTQQMVKKQITLAVPDIGNEELEEINKVFKTGFLTEGSTTKEFESAVADYLGVKHAIAVTSCTTGLHTVLECSCPFLIHSSVILVPDPRTVFITVLVGSFEP